jgi:hypothetical protein
MKYRVPNLSDFRSLSTPGQFEIETMVQVTVGLCGSGLNQISGSICPDELLVVVMTDVDGAFRSAK